MEPKGDLGHPWRVRKPQAGSYLLERAIEIETGLRVKTVVDRKR